MSETANDRLYQQCIDLIHDLFADQSVDTATARTNLQGLKDEIDTLLSTL